MLKLTSFVLEMVRACVDDIVPALSETACDRDVCNTLHLAEWLSAVKESNSGNVFWRRQLSASVLHFHSELFTVESSNKVQCADAKTFIRGY